VKNILVPTDFSELASYGLEIALKFKNAINSKLHLLKVIETAGDTIFDLEGKPKDNCTENDLTHLYIESDTALEKMTEWANDPLNEISKNVLIGPVKESIKKYIKENNIDLLIMPTSGATGFKDWFSNSKTASLAQELEIPVLSLKCDRSSTLLENIMVGGDFTEKNPENLDMALSLQKAFSSKLHLVHINTPNNLISSREANTILESFAQKHHLSNYSIHVYSDENLEKGITHYAEDYEIDLICVKNNKNMVQNFFHRNLTRSIVNHIYFPVLTLN